MDLLNLSKTTFYKFVKKYEESIFKDSLEFKSNTTNIPKKINLVILIMLL